MMKLVFDNVILLKLFFIPTAPILPFNVNLIIVVDGC